MPSNIMHLDVFAHGACVTLGAVPGLTHVRLALSAAARLTHSASQRSLRLTLPPPGSHHRAGGHSYRRHPKPAFPSHPTTTATTPTPTPERASQPPGAFPQQHTCAYTHVHARLPASTPAAPCAEAHLPAAPPPRLSGSPAPNRRAASHGSAQSSAAAAADAAALLPELLALSAEELEASLSEYGVAAPGGGGGRGWRGDKRAMAQALAEAMVAEVTA